METYGKKRLALKLSKMFTRKSGFVKLWVPMGNMVLSEEEE